MENSGADFLDGCMMCNVDRVIFRRMRAHRVNFIRNLPCVLLRLAYARHPRAFIGEPESDSASNPPPRSSDDRNLIFKSHTVRCSNVKNNELRRDLSRAAFFALRIAAQDLFVSTTSPRLCEPSPPSFQYFTPSLRSSVSGFWEKRKFPILHLELCSRRCLLFKTSPNDSEQHDGNHSNPSQEGFVKIKLPHYPQLCRAGRMFAL